MWKDMNSRTTLTRKSVKPKHLDFFLGKENETKSHLANYKIKKEYADSEKLVYNQQQDGILLGEIYSRYTLEENGH